MSSHLSDTCWTVGKHDTMIQGPGEQHRVGEEAFPNDEKALLPEEGGQSYCIDKNISGSHHKMSMALGRTLENVSRITINRKKRVRKICLENNKCKLLLEYMKNADPNLCKLQQVDHI